MLYDFTQSCMSFYAWMIYFGKWFFLIGFLLNVMVQIFYFNSQKFAISKFKFFPVINELCFFDDTRHKVLTIFEFISFSIAHTFYSVLFLTIGICLRIFLMYKVAVTNEYRCNALLFAIIPFYRMYVWFNTALSTLVENENREKQKLS